MDTPGSTPVCLTIAGLDPSGGAGIVADVRTFSAFGCFSAVAVTSVTFQNTTGVFGAVHQTADSVRRQVDAVFDDYSVAAVKTGMLPTREIIEVVAAIARERNVKNLVVDPVVRSTSGFDLIDDSALRSLIENLFPLATVITPNLPEAERIAAMEIKSGPDLQKAAYIMHRSGARVVLIKGGHSIESGKAKDHLFVDGGDPVVFEEDFIDTTSTHGTGCTLASAVAANLALSRDLETSVAEAKRFVTRAIRNAPELGRGNGPIDHFVPIT